MSLCPLCPYLSQSVPNVWSQTVLKFPKASQYILKYPKSSQLSLSVQSSPTLSQFFPINLFVSKALSWSQKRKNLKLLIFNRVRAVFFFFVKKQHLPIEESNKKKSALFFTQLELVWGATPLSPLNNFPRLGFFFGAAAPLLGLLTKIWSWLEVNVRFDL